MFYTYYTAIRFGLAKTIRITIVFCSIINTFSYRVLLIAGYDFIISNKKSMCRFNFLHMDLCCACY